MSYVYTQQRTTSQPPPGTRYYDSNTTQNLAGQGPSAYNNAYTDRGRVFARQPWVSNGNLAPQPRYNNNPAYLSPAGTSGAQLAPYAPKYDVERYKRDQRSRSRYRSKSLARHRDRSTSSSRSRSSSRSYFDKAKDGTRDVLEKTFDTRAKGLGAGVVGALVGGAIGRRVGDKHDNHALAGAIIGGLGLNALENQVHRRREARRDDKDWDRYSEDDSYRRRRRSR